MAKTVNPMETFRREQKKKELKKLKVERQKDKQAKLSSMDPTELREQLKVLERQVTGNPSDGPTRKRKQELEDTLRAVVKKQKEMQEEERKKQKEAPPPSPMTATELKELNREKFQNPENSIYYHPTLNPFGAPPPGMPQRYCGMPSGFALRGPPQPPRQGQQQQSRRGPPPRGLPRVEGRGPPSQQPHIMVRRPGKRPPLPSGPPPPGTIQVPPRPPLPSGTIPLRPPPPPPMHAPKSEMIPPPPPQQPREMAPPPAAIDIGESEVEEDSVVAPYPTTEIDDEMDQEAAELDAESQAQLRSLVPVALRVQRRVPVAPNSNSISVVSAPPVPAPPPAPRPAIPSVTITPAPATQRSSSSVSNEFDAFMEEVKDLL